MVYYKEKNKRTNLFMKPRIFVSSTFYDLKYAREDLSNFIKAHDFDPIMFENGDIGYTSGKALDDACYEAMKSADMAILIIGGNYGSTATGENPEVKDYMSITRKEFRTARAYNIPNYVFIESRVYAEYDVYEMNALSIEDGSMEIQFKATKDLNVFRFIKEVKSIGNISIKEFSKPSEIKEFLGKQWSDMFKTYLNLLREGEQRKILDESMNEMKNLISKMEIMVNGIGKKVLNGSDDYESILKMQQVILYCEKFVEAFEFNEISNLDGNKRQVFIENLLSVLKDSIKDELWIKIQSDVEKENKKFFDYFTTKGIDLENVTIGFEKDLVNIFKFIEIPENKRALIASLIDDKYYKKMIAIGK